MKKALVVGGNSGIGLALVCELIKYEYDHVYICGLNDVKDSDLPIASKDFFDKKTSFFKLNLNFMDYSVFDEIRDIDTLIITAGFGRIALFEDLKEAEIANLIKVNELGPIEIIKKYYDKIKSDEHFNCAVMVSIAGHIASPYFSIYGASKSGLASFIENINVELEAAGYANRILDVSPGSIKGTSFSGAGTQVDMLQSLSHEIIKRMNNNESIYIPDYDSVFCNVIRRYQEDPVKFGLDSYKYKKEGGRVSLKPQLIVGYLSGTFDLFHIGHLNILKRAKEQCDYLIVGVHASGKRKGKETFIPLEERKAIVSSIKYVDKVIDSLPEDCDVWNTYKYDKLFVGSDYKGSERFNRYEEYFKDKGVEIVYFPYTKGTSSTQLREAIR